MKATNYTSSLLQTLAKETSHLESEQAEAKMRIAANIDDLLRHRAWTQAQFAAAVNKQASEISKWLSGTHNFTVDTLVQIALVLEVRLMDLVQEPESKLVFHTRFELQSASSRTTSNQNPTTPNSQENKHTLLPLKKTQVNVNIRAYEQKS